MPLGGVCHLLTEVKRGPNKGDIITGANKNNPFYNQFWNFEDFFSSRELAKKAWEDTLWFRLGFTYDQLQNPDNYLKERAFNVDYQVQGTTTGANIDSSIIPFNSSNYNNYRYPRGSYYLCASSSYSGSAWSRY